MSKNHMNGRYPKKDILFSQMGKTHEENLEVDRNVVRYVNPQSLKRDSNTQ